MRRSAIFVGLLCAFATGAALSVDENEKTLYLPVFRSRIPGDSVKGVGFEYRLSTSLGDDGEYAAYFYYEDTRIHRWPIIDPEFVFSGVKSGEILVIRNVAYQIRVGKGGLHGKEYALPMEMRPQGVSIVIPFSPNSFRVGITYRVSETGSDADGKWAIIEATTKRSYKESETVPEKVRVGSQATIQGRKFEVLNIVEKDASKKITGWVELSSKATAENRGSND